MILPPMRSRLFHRVIPRLLVLGMVAVLTGCAGNYAKVREHPIKRTVLFAPRLVLEVLGSPGKIARAIKEEKSRPQDALGIYLVSLEAASRELERTPNDKDARDAYNFALSRVLATIRKAGLDPWTQPLRVPTAKGEYVITNQPDPRPGWQPELYDLVPASEIDVSGTYVSDRISKQGLGAPLVSIGREATRNSKQNFETQRVYYGVTAVARFTKDRQCVIAFEDPLASETVRFGGHQHELAADYTAPLAFMLAESDIKKIELRRLLRPDKFDDTERLAKLQPYDPNKTIVLVIHGLKDSQATWTPMVNQLRGDPMVRKNYQFWFFSYPTGYPYGYSAALLRRELDKLNQRYPNTKPMVVIGHSMGGCISRLLITDTGEEMWKRYFGKPPAMTELNKDAETFFKELLVFQHRPEVGRVIFIAAPLKGSKLASNWVGRLGSRLVRLPRSLLQISGDAMRLVLTLDDDFLKLKHLPNSVDTLAPNNRFVKTINTFPIVPGIPYHTIMGDRGKGGNTDDTKPVRSDGVVPYWSSHMPGAQSELIVPSGHSAHKHPATIQEVQRILHLHAGTRRGK